MQSQIRDATKWTLTKDTGLPAASVQAFHQCSTGQADDNAAMLRIRETEAQGGQTLDTLRRRSL